MVNSRSRSYEESVKQRELERVGKYGKNKKKRDRVKENVKLSGDAEKSKMLDE